MLKKSRLFIFRLKPIIVDQTFDTGLPLSADFQSLRLITTMQSRLDFNNRATILGDRNTYASTVRDQSAARIEYHLC